MGDALRALIGAVRLDVTYTAELEADPGSAWTHHFPTDRLGHVWVATQTGPIWVGRGDDVERLERRKGALIAPGARAWVGTSWRPDHDAPRATAVSEYADLGIAPGSTGIHHGTATFGPLMSEALALPDFFTTAWDPQPDTDVHFALEQVADQLAHRWPGAHHDALARVLVVTLVRAWRPPVLRDNSLIRCIDAIAEPGPPPTIPELATLANVSESTLLRRFRASTGLTSDEFIRWFRTLAVRTALLAGMSESDSIRSFEFASVRALRRTLCRAEAAAARVTRSGPDIPPWR